MSDFGLAGKLFKRGWGWTVASPFVLVGVTLGGLFNWNWKGPGIPNKKEMNNGNYWS